MTDANRGSTDDGVRAAARLAEAVRTGGGRALVVGGWVRDRLRGQASKDVDIEVFGLPAERVRALLEAMGRVETVGESFQVFKAGEIDVSLPRRETRNQRLPAGKPLMAARRRSPALATTM